MNKKVYALALVASFMGFTSCDSDEEDIISNLKQKIDQPITPPTTNTGNASSELKVEEVAVGNWKVKSVVAMGQNISPDCVSKGRAVYGKEKLSLKIFAITPMTGAECVAIASIKDQPVSLADKKVKLNVMGMDMEFDVSAADKDHLLLKKESIPVMEITLERTNEAVVIETETTPTSSPTQPVAPAIAKERIAQALAGNWQVESIALGGNTDTDCASQGTFNVADGNVSMKVFYNLGTCAPIMEKNNEPLKLNEKGEILVTTALLPGQEVNLAIEPVDATHINLTNATMALVIKLKK